MALTPVQVPTYIISKYLADTSNSYSTITSYLTCLKPIYYLPAKPSLPPNSIRQQSPTFGATGNSFMEYNFFPQIGDKSSGFRMIRAHYIYCALYFYYYYVSSTSDHQALIGSERLGTPAIRVLKG